MATTVVKTIGTTSRDYSTIQAWEDACPANLVTADQIWRGECYNDSEFTAGVIISGETTDATRYVELTAAAGQSFQDHADVRTNPLRYDQTKGVAVTTTSSYTTLIACSYGTPHTRISRLQLKATSSPGRALNLADTGMIGRDCLCISNASDNVISLGYGGAAYNMVAVQLGTGAAFVVASGSKLVGSTGVKPSDITASGTAFVSEYSNNIAQSCAAFGFTTAASPTGWDTTNSKYNATNLASGLPGTTGNVYNVTYNQTTPFTDADKDSLDLRAIAATSLAAAGYRDSTNAPNDISKTARAASPTIGAWELVAAASGPANLKTINSLAKASVKTVNGLAIASVKTWNGLA